MDRSARSPRALSVLLFSAIVALAACSPAASPAPASAPAPAAKPPQAAAPAPPAASGAPGAATQPAPAPLSPPVPIKVGSIGTVAERGLFIGLDRGYFAEEGLDVELVPSRTITDSIPSLLTGELQYCTGGAEPALFNAALRGVGVKIVNYNIFVGRGELSSGFVVRQDVIDGGRYREPTDLKDLTVALPPGSGTPQVFLEHIMEQAGSTLADAQIVPLPFPDMVPAITNRGVEAAFLAEPFISVLERQGTAQLSLPTGVLQPEMAANVLVISPPFADQQPEAARRFMAAHLRGQRDYYRAIQKNDGGRDDIIQILIKYTPIKDSNLYDKLLTSPVDPNLEMDERLLNAVQDFYLRHGVVPQRLEAKQVVDRSYADYALQRLGRLQ
jgi:NitT/TauT family transport system substrate-binding protein